MSIISPGSGVARSTVGLQSRNRSTFDDYSQGLIHLALSLLARRVCKCAMQIPVSLSLSLPPPVFFSVLLLSRGDKNVGLMKTWKSTGGGFKSKTLKLGRMRGNIHLSYRIKSFDGRDTKIYITTTIKKRRKRII